MFFWVPAFWVWGAGMFGFAAVGQRGRGGRGLTLPTEAGPRARRGDSSGFFGGDWRAYGTHGRHGIQNGKAGMVPMFFWVPAFCFWDAGTFGFAAVGQRGGGGRDLILPTEAGPRARRGDSSGFFGGDWRAYGIHGRHGIQNGKAGMRKPEGLLGSCFFCFGTEADARLRRGFLSRAMKMGLQDGA